MDKDFNTDEVRDERRKRAPKKKLLHPGLLALIDILLAAFLILLFAYIDHGKAYLFGENDDPIDAPNISTKQLKFSLDAPKKGVGEDLTATLSVTGGKELSSATLYLTYNPSLLEVNKDYSIGELLTAEATSDFSEQTDENGNKVLVFKASAPKDKALFPKDGTVFSVSFKVKGVLVEKDLPTLSVPEDGLLKKDGSTVTAKIENTGKNESVFADKFTDGEVLETEKSYKSANVNVSWERHEEEIGGKKVVYYLADIYLKSPDLLRTEISDGFAERVAAMAKRKDAVIAINGDYFRARKKGVVVRNGELIREGPSFEDVLVMFEDGTMETYTKTQFNFDKAKEQGIMHAWSFGPMLLKNGKAMTEFNTDVGRANPRTAIGYYEPGHYCFLSVNGRGEEGSEGIRMEEMSKLFEGWGCQRAYNLDGGQTSVMIWGKDYSEINTPYKGGRTTSDMVYIAKE